MKYHGIKFLTPHPQTKNKKTKKIRDYFLTWKSLCEVQQNDNFYSIQSLIQCVQMKNYIKCILLSSLST